MSKFVIILYCVIGIAFFVRDMFAKVEIGAAAIHALIWPYAQWALIKAETLSFYAQAHAQVVSHLPH